MRLYDQHLHTWYSNDSSADPADNVRRAMELGLAGLTMTDHYDTHPDERGQCLYDYGKIADALAGLRERRGDRLFVGHGIEVCYQPAQMESVIAWLEEHRFDIVLLSVHWFDGRALHVREHWEGIDAAQATRRYLETVLDAARFVRRLHLEGRHPFDVLGHLDLVKRYTRRYFGTFNIRAFSELVDEILTTCLEAELIPEVNLSSLRQSVTEPMPAEWVVRRYAELGGEAMTLGSDAHRPEDVGFGVAEGVDLLRSAGLKRLAVFKERRRCDEVLECPK